MGTSSKIARPNPVRKHQRDVWLKIIMPVALPSLALIALCVVLAVAVASDTLASKQITIIMSILATCFISVPLMLLCLIPYFLLAMSAALAGKGYAHARTPLRFARRTTEQVADKTSEYVPRLAQPVLALNVRLTRLEKTLSSWLQLDDSSKDESHG